MKQFRTCIKIKMAVLWNSVKVMMMMMMIIIQIHSLFLCAASTANGQL
jgi:hypothetical protein